MSRKSPLPHRLLTAGVLGLALFLTASNFRTDAPQVANSPAARATEAKPQAYVSQPPHLGVAAVSPRQRYIVQSESAEAAGAAVSLAGGVVTGDLSVIRAVAASLDEREMSALRAQGLVQVALLV